MKFYPERLTQLRESLNISKAEAARRLNISAMTYGRCEKGEREPSYQSVCYIAQVFHCNVDFLYVVSDDMDCDYIIISRSESPDLYALVEIMKKDAELSNRLTIYARELLKKEKTPEN